MKKFLVIMAIALIASGSATAYAKADHGGGNNRGRGDSNESEHGNQNFGLALGKFNFNLNPKDENKNVAVKVNFKVSPVMEVKVTSISGSKISATNANGLNVSIDTTGAILMARSGNKNMIALTDIQAGDILIMTGSASTDGNTFNAKFIRDLSLKAARMTGTNNGTFSGTVVSVGVTGAGTFVIGNQIITTNASTTFTKNGAAATFADLAAGESVTGNGSFDATKTVFTATSVAITAAAPTTTNASITGSLTAINGNSLSVLSGSTTFTVDATSAAITRSGVSGNVGVATLHTGDTLQVTGSQTNGTNNIAATTINDTTLLTVNFTGTLSAAPNGNTLTVLSGSTTFTVDATNATITRTGVTGNVLVSTLHQNDSLQISGTQTSPTAVNATTISDQTAL